MHDDTPGDPTGKVAIVVGGEALLGDALVSAFDAAGWKVVRERRIEEVAKGHTDVPETALWLILPGRDSSGGGDDLVDPQELVGRIAPERMGLVLISSEDRYDSADISVAEVSPVPESDARGGYIRAWERAVCDRSPTHLILRTTFVYGWNPRSSNAAMQIYRTLSAGEQLRVPPGRMVTPTLADWLGEIALRLVEDGVTGVVNVVGPERMDAVAFAHSVARALVLPTDLIIEDVESAPIWLAGAGAAVISSDRLHSITHTDAPSVSEAMKRIRRQWRRDTVKTLPQVAAGDAASALRQRILRDVADYAALAHAPEPFVPFVSPIPYAGRVYGAEEITQLVDASLEFWLTLGPWGDRFEHTLARRLGARDVVLVNSGSSANLVAVTALRSHLRERPLLPGDEVITPAVTFPTTLAPLLQNGLVPVLVDVEPGTYDLDPVLVREAVTSRTRAILAPHTLGNPCDLQALVEIAREHDLVLVEDCCDALGATFDGKPVGTFGELATLSFYPAHHITMGEGGAVIVNAPGMSRIVRSIRDWGRDCWCAPGESNTCGTRFGGRIKGLPDGYDHKYTYTHVGYNLKPTDLQAAIGVAQLERLDGFVASRRAHFARLFAALQPYRDRLLLPRWNERADPSWFGFPITVTDGSRRQLVQWLEEAKIETRQIFSGNILRQPAYRDAAVRVHGSLAVSDTVADNAFFIGVYPGMSDVMLDFIVDRFAVYFASH